MKCDKRNSKLERFEETVDGVMDWIYDAELFVSSAVEGTYEAVKERTDRLEVGVSFCALEFICALSFCFNVRKVVKLAVCVIYGTLRCVMQLLLL